MWIEPNRSTYSTPWTTAIAALALALVFAPGARGQQRTLYDARSGKVVGHAVTDSAGAVTLYGPAGRVTGRTSTGTDGTTVVYGADGRRVGTVTAPPERKGK